MKDYVEEEPGFGLTAVMPPFPTPLRLAGLFFFAAGLCAQQDDGALRDLLERYEATRGGIIKLEALGALQVEGVTKQQGQVYAFTLYKKRPGLVRFRMQRGEESVILGYDGRTAWKRVLRGSERVTESLDATGAELLGEEAALRDPLARALETFNRQVRYLGEEENDGVRTHAVEVFGPWKTRSVYFLDSETLDIIRRQRFDARGGQVLETLYADYREVEGYRFAFRIENQLDGETLSVTRLEAIQVNPGVLNFYFRPPQ